MNFIDRTGSSTLHALGFNDPRVEIDHWKRLEPKLKPYGKTCAVIIEAEEGHGFRNEDPRVDFYRRLESFLAQYL